MSLKDRLLDLDSRLGVPRNADEAFEQNVRYWWAGLAISIATILVTTALAVFVGFGVLGVAVVMSPLAAFASGYYYAERMRAAGERSPWFDRRESDAP